MPVSANERATQLAGESLIAEQTMTAAGRALADLDESDDPESPASPHPAVRRMRPGWRMARALMRGTRGIRDGGELYLPRYPLESQARYEIRNQKVGLFNAYKRTIVAFAGLVFRVRPKLGPKMPQELVDDWENIDRRGKHGAVFARELFVDALATGGPAGILVSYPTVPNAGSIDAQQAEDMNLRPYWVRIAADDVVSWRTSSDDGAPYLRQITFKEVTEIDVGAFGVALETRYRVFRRAGTTVTVEVWKKRPATTGTAESAAAGERFELMADPITLRNMDEIPFAPCVLGEVLGFLESSPPVEDLMYLNIEYHQTRTELSNVRGLACVPTIKRKGYKPRSVGPGKTVIDPVVLGADQVVDVPIDGDVDWFSPDVSVLEPGREALLDLRAEMGAVGVAFLAPETRSADTATAAAIDASSRDGSLASSAGILEDCIERAFQFSAKYRKLPATDGVTVNNDFAQLMADPQLITALSNATSAGNMPQEDFLAFLERVRILPENYDVGAAVEKLVAGIRGLSSNRPAPTVASGDLAA